MSILLGLLQRPHLLTKNGQTINTCGMHNQLHPLIHIGCIYGMQ